MIWTQKKHKKTISTTHLHHSGVGGGGITIRWVSADT